MKYLQALLLLLALAFCTLSSTSCTKDGQENVFHPDQRVRQRETKLMETEHKALSPRTGRSGK